VSAKSADLLLEIGTEEIPARFLPSARRQLKALAEKHLAAASLAHGDLRVYATPRRLAILAEGVPVVQPDRPFTELGPLKTQAFDPSGKPTPAAEGFARKHSVAVSALKVVEDKKGPRMAVSGVELGRAAAEVLPGVLESVLKGFEFPRAMRWPQAPGRTFARPIRWLVAMHGTKALRFSVGEVAAAPATMGRRFVHPKPLPVKSAGDYLKVLKKAGILVDETERKALIRREADRLAVKASGRVLWDEALLAEVADLVEAPCPLLGTFPREALELPQAVIVAAMQEHQRYFPVVDEAAKLLPHFITVANGVATRSVVAGNERVLKARLADARFFWTTDSRKKLEDGLAALGGVVWQANGGTMLDKAKRVERLARVLAMYYKTLKVLPGIDHEAVGRAGLLAKADLVTAMVGEFPGLQGVVGGLYAAASGEPPAVVRGIAEHYRPSGPGDDIPASDEGCLVALADKVDHLAGHFRLGHAPTGTADPYGLRRAAIGIIRILAEREWRLPMPLSALLGVSASEHVDREHLAAEILKAAKATEPLPLIDLGTRKVVLAAHAFIRARLEAVFEEQGFQHDEIQAALVDFEDILYATRRLKALVTLKMRPGFRDTLLALSRVTNILAKVEGEGSASREALDEPERELYDAHQRVAARARELAEAGDFEALYGVLATLKPAIDAFFDRVLVMDPDEAVRRRRLDLLKLVEGTIRLFVDVRQLALI
jgi:glycyl-tRNA synthetase beta chain